MSWTGFFPNLIGVVLGILLTFGVNSLWQQCEEKKKIKEILILVRNELENNKYWFKNQENVMKTDSYVYKKILEAKGNWTSFPIDTLHTYLSQVTSWEFSQLTTSSWQIFQNSEMIQKVSDKELVIRLSTCYFWIDEMQKIIMKEYWDKKVKANAFELDPYKYFDVVMNNKESLFFYNSMTMNNSFWDIFPQIDAVIDYSIMLLDKYGNYQYDMNEKDEEFTSFINARLDSVNQIKSRKSN